MTEQRNHSSGRFRPELSLAQVRIRPGLTLVEVLVVLLVVAVVTAITLTSLHSARTSAGETKQLADLRSGAALFASWSHDHNEEFLNIQRDPQRYAMRCADDRDFVALYILGYEPSVGWFPFWLMSVSAHRDTTPEDRRAPYIPAF